MSTTFPDGFLWGAATAAHQVEGGNVNNDHWEMEHAPHTPFVEPSGDACDSYHRWREDLDLVAGAGLNTYRFSLEWSRIEPEEGEFSRAALDHYRRMVDGCRERGLNPLVTLVHFTQPRWLLHDGGWTGAKTGDRIARYTEFVAPILDDAAYVATINEPNLMATQPVMARMAMSGQEIKGLPRPDQEVADALIGLHGRMTDALRGVRPPVGWTLIGRENIAEDGGEDVMRAERAAFEDQFLEVARGDDWVGQQIYTCARFGPDGLVAPAPELHTLAHGMERRPEALGAAVTRAAEVLGGNTPILVTENGIATADDEDRIRFTTDALTGLAAAIEGGADVRGYVHWSLLDNFEWMLGYRPTFGLVSVDRTTFARTPKPSLAWLGEVARRNGLV